MTALDDLKAAIEVALDATSKARTHADRLDVTLDCAGQSPTTELLCQAFVALDVALDNAGKTAVELDAQSEDEN